MTGNKKGYSLVELVVVMAIAGILAVIAVPQYANFTAKGNVRKAANDLLQNTRLARTLAIRDNQVYMISFDIPGNSYTIGFDSDGDSILDTFDNGPERVFDLQREYGNDIQFGTFTATGPAEPDICGSCIAIGGSTVAFGPAAGTVEQFNPDGSVSLRGSVFINHTRLGYTYMVRVSYLSGKFDLWKWDGEIDNPDPPDVLSCAASPIRYCDWTEVR